ncbi:MAG TPA: formyltransferase family protein [Gemmatimonadaceae bacterium]|nr:formyltransferase family protein [Gemmatimonadaceae bacterium]
MRLILVTHDSAYARYFAAGLHAAARLDELIVETGGEPWRFYLRKLRRVGPANFAFQAWLNRWFRREGARHLPDSPMPPHERVPTVSGRAFATDDLVIGFGTSYITAATLAAAPRGILNLHTGLLPQYRGVKSEFWTLYNRDPENAGWTLHYMTPRLDAGDVVLRQRVPWSGENPAALRAKLLADAVPAIAALVRRVRAEGFGAVPRAPQGDGRYYTTPTWRDWRRFMNGGMSVG